MKTHMCTHSGEKPYVCSHCDKCYTTLNSLRIHEFKYNGKVKPFVCDICGYSFVVKGDLKARVNTHR
jgi:uncharacterized Zn-finger protein